MKPEGEIVREVAGLGQGLHTEQGARSPQGTAQNRKSGLGARAHFSIAGGLSRIQHLPQMERNWPTELSNVFILLKLSELSEVLLMHEACHGFYWQLPRSSIITNDAIR